MSQENPNPQPPSNSELEESYSPDREPILGQTSNSSPTPSVLEKFQSVWNGALVKIRSLLPENLASKLSDRALTGIIVAIALLLVGVSANTFSPKPKEIAAVPPQTEAPNSNPIPQSKSVKSTTSLPIEQNKSTLKDTTTSSKIDDSSVKETPELLSPVPQGKTSSNSDKKQIVETKQQIKQQKNPALTPEQTLVAIVENQISGAIADLHEKTQSESFSSKLINSVQADFASSTLTLKISDDWYSLEHPQQNKLAAEILERSKELDFSHLEITDSKNKLIARNPVVGNEMIIIKR